MSGQIIVLGVDPGFANIGLMVIRFTASGGCGIKYSLDLHTEPEGRRRKLREHEDDERRSEIIQREFTRVLNEQQPDIVATERCPSLRNAKASRKTALGYATMRAIVRARNMTWLTFDVDEIKQRVTGDKKAGKPEMIAGLKRLFPAYKGWPSTKRVEHVADAGGAALCAERDPIFELLMRERSR